MKERTNQMHKRFRSFLPVVVDVETAGFDAKGDALLEIAAVLIHMQEDGTIATGDTHSYHVIPFEGANLDQDALEFNQIDPFHPFRFAVSELDALSGLFEIVKIALKDSNCSKAVLVGHNAWFDLGFIKEASIRSKLDMPFHSFTSLDTATLGALAYGQTVLARALKMANIQFDKSKAHSAIYDAEKTAELFCKIVNHTTTDI